MSQLYPFLMSPAFDPRPWGTLDLSPIYPNHQCSERIGEAWLTGDDCRVTNGPLAKRSLSDLSRQFGAALTGSAAPDPHRFPLLLKFLFPADKLSVQVHPDDETARRFGEPWGKTECWYVAHARPGSQVALGLKRGVTRTQFEEAIHDARAEDLLNWIDLEPGDMIYVAGGTVHTLGPGSVLVETQQQSDTTYRLYDYGRPRELHLERGLASIKENVGSGKVAHHSAVHNGRNSHCPMISAPFFMVDRFEARAPQAFSTEGSAAKNSVQILVALDGCGIVEAPGCDPVALAKGDAVVVPASVEEFRICPQWNVGFLKAYVPGESVPEPITALQG
jgi:mannose-6-phosphate isomerase